MLSTGDRGHFDPGTGSLVIDHHEYDVVTLDGVRIDLAALDRAAGQVAGVGYAVSVVAAGGLDVGVVCDSDEVDRQRVRAAVRRRVDDEVPASTRPRRVVVLDELPTDVTGNLDRRAAAESIAAAPEAQTAYRPPTTATEVAVAEAVTEVLGVPRPSMDDELVRLGATSLGFMQLATHLGSTLRVVVNMRDLASVTTLAELAAVIEAAVPRRTTSTDGVVAYRPTRAQQEIWLLNRADPHATVYHLPVRLTLAEQISADAVRMALIDVATRHEALRTVYPEVDGEPVAQVRDQDESAAAAPVTSATLDAAGVDHAVSAPFDLRTEVPGERCSTRRAKPSNWFSSPTTSPSTSGRCTSCWRISPTRCVRVPPAQDPSGRPRPSPSARSWMREPPVRRPRQRLRRRSSGPGSGGMRRIGSPCPNPRRALRRGPGSPPDRRSTRVGGSGARSPKPRPRERESAAPPSTRFCAWPSRQPSVSSPTPTTS